jgi:threonine synthase
MIGFVYLDDQEWPPAGPPTIWRYWRRLPVDDPRAAVTLGEGGTPLLPLPLTPAHDVFVKDETRNPTGSHKDRALSVAISRCVSLGRKASVVVSAGSTGLSHAAYCAHAGITSIVAIPAATDPRRIYPLTAMGSRVIRVQSDIDAIIARTGEIARSRGLFQSSTTRRANPFQTEAAKTIAFEIVDTLGEPPDFVVVPVGGGGTIAGIWRGFRELRERGSIARSPRFIGVVPEGYDALAAAYRKGIETQAEFDALPYSAVTPTLMPKLAHAHPPDGLEALAAVKDSGGYFCVATNRDAEEGQARFATGFGHYVELSSAGVLAATHSVLRQLDTGRRASIVLILCGSGYRESFVDIERNAIPENRSSLDALDASIEEALRPAAAAP